jgi:hypothetical protein
LQAVEGLVQQYFDPAVAFTSAPLDENDNPLPISNTEEDPIEDDVLDPSKKAHMTNKEMAESYYLVPSPDGSDDPVSLIQKQLGTLSIASNHNQRYKDDPLEQVEKRLIVHTAVAKVLIIE